MRYLAFDLGASSGKMVLGDFDGERISTRPVHSFKNGVVPMGGALYWDFPGIWRELLTGISLAERDASFVSLGIDSFNNDFSFVDRRGEMLFPVRAYRDPRTIEHEEAIYARIGRQALYMHSGNQLAPFNTYMQLAAMVENGQDYLFERADNLLMLPDLLVFYLTGNRVIEYTLAAETQMLDLKSRRWIPETLDAIGFPERLFAPLVMPGTVAGRAAGDVCREIGVKPFNVVSVCEHDTASAFLAAPLTERAAVISSGTWAIVGTETASPCVSEYGYLHNIANEGGYPGHHRLLKNVMGSWLLQELIRDFALDGQTYDYGEIQHLALDAPPFAHMIDADDRRFYEPGDMRRKIADACIEAGGRAPDSPGAYFRAVYEALSFKYRRALDELETLTGKKHDVVHMIGGGSLDAVGCQFAANAASRPLVAGPVEGSALGNILVQMIASGEIASIDEGRRILRASVSYQTYEPQDSTLWREQYARYCEKIDRQPPDNRPN